MAEEKQANLTQVKLYLTPEAHDKLRAASSASRASMSELVGFMVEHFLDTSAGLLSPPPEGDPRIEEAKERVAGGPLPPRPVARPSSDEDFVGE